jgi:hypothetical protein
VDLPIWKVQPILSNMESMSATPSDPAGDLAAAEAASRRLTGSLRLPSWFHSSLGAAIALQVGTAAYGIAGQDGAHLAVAVAGVVVFLAVAVVQVRRFRQLNRVRVDGLVSRAVLGTSTRSSVAYAAGFAAAAWAALADHAWLAAVASLATGAGYAGSAALWWRDYLRDPSGHAMAESRATLLLYVVVAVAALVALVAAR